MKKIWLYSVRNYISLGLFFYFKRIEIHGIENVPKDKPVLLLGNHQNALLDALLIATKCGRFSYFLTRAAVFKKAFVSKILKSLQMLPVYRVRDGWSNISNNNAIFESCTQILNNNEAVVIFPEGNHNLARRVRPLSKGFTRIVFNTLEKYPEIDLQLVPVGLNYVNAKACPDSIAIYFGKSFSAKQFVGENKNKAVIKLKNAVHSKIASLTTHIPEDNYEEDLHELMTLNVDFLKPKSVNLCLENDFLNCEIKSKTRKSFLSALFQILLKINLIIPFAIWKFVVKPRIKEIEFVSTFRFVIAITLVPLYLLILTYLISSMFTISLGLLYLAASLLLALITVKL